MIQTWSDVFTQSLQSLWFGTADFLPKLIVALLVFVIGWVLGSIIGKGISQIVSALKIDNLLKSMGMEDVMNKAGSRLNSGNFVGELVKWFIIIVFLITSLEIVGLKEVNLFLRDAVLSYLPRVLIAALVLVAATVLADFIGRVVVGSARAANIRHGKFIGAVTRWSIWIFAMIIALSELGIGAQFMQILFAGIVAMLAISFGLAFGLGGKEAASRSLEKMKENMMNNG